MHDLCITAYILSFISKTSIFEFNTYAKIDVKVPTKSHGNCVLDLDNITYTGAKWFEPLYSNFGNYKRLSSVYQVVSKIKRLSSRI